MKSLTVQALRLLPNKVYFFCLRSYSLLFSNNNEKIVSIRQSDELWVMEFTYSPRELMHNSISALYFQYPKRADRFLKGRAHALSTNYQKYCFPPLEVIENAYVIDVGANIGQFALNFIEIPNIKVVAFEPDDLALKCLQLNDPDNIIEKLSLIAGNRSGKVDFFVSSEHANSSTVLPNEFTSVQSKKSVKLLDYISTNLDPKKKIFIKVDAEGGEPEVLEGLLGIDPKRLSFMAVDCGPERNGQRTEDMVLKLLKRLDFRTIKLASANILVGSNL